MAADAWKKFNAFPLKLGQGVTLLNSDTFKMMLLTSAWTPNAQTQVNYADISASEVSNANGYTTGGVTLTTVTWTQSTSTVKFTCDPAQWTAAAAGITFRYAVVYDSTAAGSPLLCYSLTDNSPADITVTAGNVLSIAMNASGCFTITGM